MTANSRSGRLLALSLHGPLLVLAIFWLAPLWMMVVSSTKPDSELYTSFGAVFPGSHFRDNLQLLIRETPFLTALANSFVIAIVTCFLSATLSSMAGYALARFQLFGAKFVVGIVVASLMVPYLVVIIPQFVMIARVFHLTNTKAGVILPTLCNGMGVFFMRQHFLLIPQEILDAARVEGIGEMMIFTRIAVPLALPALSTLSVMLFLQAWNNYLWPLIILTDPKNWTAPVALGTIVGSIDKVMWGAIMAGTVLMTLPVLILYLIFQRRIFSTVSVETPQRPVSGAHSNSIYEVVQRQF